MLRATKDKMLPTTITGSLPRPSWYTQNLGMRSFLDAMVNNQFREQYVDAVSVYLHEQEIAGLDIVTDGDAHFDSDVGGQSWTNYPPRHMGGFDKNPQPTEGEARHWLAGNLCRCTGYDKIIRSVLAAAEVTSGK